MSFTCCTDNINAIAEFVPNASESVFCHRLYYSRDAVCELIQVRTKTRSFTYPHKKKSQGVMSRDLGGQEFSAKSLGPLRPIQRCRNVSFRSRRI